MREEARKGDLVQIHQVILAPGERPETIPDCTRRVPYEAWLKGFLLEDRAKVGETVKIETFIGREVSGTLAAVDPAYDHGFGRPPVELIQASLEARERLEKGARGAGR